MIGTSVLCELTNLGKPAGIFVSSTSISNLPFDCAGLLTLDGNSSERPREMILVPREAWELAGHLKVYNLGSNPIEFKDLAPHLPWAGHLTEADNAELVAILSEITQTYKCGLGDY